MNKRLIASMNRLNWPKEYRQGSTIFLVDSKPGKEWGEKDRVQGFTCGTCGWFGREYLHDELFERHEIMHLLQALRRLTSDSKLSPEELVFEP